MIKKHFLKTLVTELTEALPAHLHAFKKDFEKNSQRILSKAFAKFDLVTREEFDIQCKVLARSRKQLEELEQQIQQLEALLKDKH